MLIRAVDVPHLQQAVTAEDYASLKSLQIDKFLLESVGELLCSAWQWQLQDNAIALDLFSSWAEKHTILQQGWEALNNTSRIFTSLSRPFDTPTQEIATIPGVKDYHQDWRIFQSRFARSLEHNGGFSRPVSLAISGALKEMTDNVIEHSSSGIQSPACAITGYEIENRSMTFIIADVGRGILNSLRTNPLWASLEKDDEALKWAILKSATSRVNSPQGEGFQQVHRALADFQGTLRFRSGSASLTLDGRNLDARNMVISYPPDLVGVQISITCRIA